LARTSTLGSFAPHRAGVTCCLVVIMALMVGGVLGSAKARAFKSQFEVYY